jgi:hypothetical protein
MTMEEARATFFIDAVMLLSWWQEHPPVRVMYALSFKYPI